MSYDQYSMPGKLRWANYKFKQAELSVRFYTASIANQFDRDPANAEQFRILSNMLSRAAIECDYWKVEVHKLQTSTLSV
jgi:hypothetical protein